MLFIHSLVYNCQKLPCQFDKDGRPCYQFRQAGETDPKIIIPRVHRIWREIACNSRWGPSRGSWTSHMTKVGAAAFCKPMEFEYEKTDIGKKRSMKGPDLQGTQKYGFSSQIFFHEKYLERIKTYRGSGLDQDLPLLAVQFELAITLCHEVIHAIRNADISHYRRRMEILWKNPSSLTTFRRPPEPYYEDETTAELGESYVNNLLGGRLLTTDVWNGDEGNVPIITTWPNSYTTKHRIPQRGDLAQSGRGPENHFPISMRYIHMVQTQEFW